MLVKCKNCNNSFKGNFCNQCGQSANTHTLNLGFLWHDIQHGLFHFDFGIYYSLKELYTRPGHSIREFISGKRVKHFKPISLVIVLATVYGLLYHSLGINVFTGKTSSPELSEAVNKWISTHYSWVTLASIPIYTLGTYISFKKQGYNYIEYVILNSFKASQRLFFHIISFPVLYYFNGTENIKLITGIFYGIDIILIYWTNFQFFNRLGKLKTLLLTMLSHLIFLTAFLIVLTIVLFMNGLLK